MRNKLIGALLAAALLVSCGGTYTEEQMAFVSRPFLLDYDTEVRLHFDNRTCKASWPHGEELPPRDSLWLLELDIDCRIHGVVNPVDVATLARQTWLEGLFSTRIPCDVDHVKPLILNHCMYPKDAAVGLYAIGEDVVDVTSIHPAQQRKLRVGKRCTFTFDRLVWDEDQERYKPLYYDWRASPVVHADCPHP